MQRDQHLSSKSIERMVNKFAEKKSQGTGSQGGVVDSPLSSQNVSEVNVTDSRE